MDDAKLQLSDESVNKANPSYKTIPETDMEEEAVNRSKNLVKPKQTSLEDDGADEKMLPTGEKVGIKITCNEKQNGDAKLDIGEIKSAFVGLTKEELMKYANDPFWVRLRWFLFITFWILWGTMLIGAVMIICAAPKCNSPLPRTWWQRGPLVEIERDIKPKEVKMLKDNGVTGVIVSWPEEAYINFNENHEFIKSLKKYKDEDLYLIVELEPGSSKLWFNKSEHKEGQFVNYYIWSPPKSLSNGGTPEPPNNWLTTENNSSWIYSETRREFYYAPKGRPHLNFRNQNVTEKFSDVLKTILDYGIDGVRLRGVPFLLVDPKFENEGIKQQSTNLVLTEYGFYTHTKTEHLADLGPLLKQWNIIVKNKTNNGPFMVAEDLSNIESYKVNSTLVVDLPVKSHLFSKTNITVNEIMNILTSTFTIDNITWPLWKCNSNEVLDIIAFLLPGTPLIKYNASINKELLKNRNSPSIMRGTFNFQAVNHGTVFAFVRVTAGNPGILVALNPTKHVIEVNFPKEIPAVSPEVTVLLYANYNESGITVNVKQNAQRIPLSPESAIVMTYVPSTSET